jgi:hypothetical protein
VIPALLVAIAALATLLWVLLPLRQGHADIPSEPSRELDEALAEKRAALTAIVDIENERAVGKMSPHDFDVLKAEYESQAIAALRAADSLRDAGHSDEDVELEIAALKERLRCPHCGAARIPGEACGQCGN